VAESASHIFSSVRIESTLDQFTHSPVVVENRFPVSPISLVFPGSRVSTVVAAVLTTVDRSEVFAACLAGLRVGELLCSPIATPLVLGRLLAFLRTELLTQRADEVFTALAARSRNAMSVRFRKPSELLHR